MKKKTKPRKPRKLNYRVGQCAEYNYATVYSKYIKGSFLIRFYGNLKDAKKLHKFLEQYIKWRGRG